MIHKLRNLILGIVTITGLAAVPVTVMAPLAAADSTNCSSPADCAGSGLSSVSNGGSSPNEDDLKNNIKTVVNVMLFVLGAIAVIMIIIGGIRYTTSNGDAGNVKSAKDTILYAVVGLVVAILAYAIVNFVISSFKGN